MNRKQVLFVAAAVVSFLFATGHLVRLNRLSKKMRAAPSSIETTSVVSMDGIEGRISQASAQVGIKKLLGVSVRESAGTKEIHLEWEADQAASLAFVGHLRQKNLIGPCLRLNLAASDNAASSMRASGDWAFATHGALIANSAAPVPVIRDVFKPLWTAGAVAQPDVNRIEVARLKKQEQEMKAEEERRGLEQKARDEAERLASKKNRLESIAVNGVVSNGREAVAYVTSPSGQMQALRAGDMVEEARVTAVDEARGEVRLDYAGQFQVTLRMRKL